jgi:predicted nuclease of predicted toxin-antitoxin system
VKLKLDDNLPADAVAAARSAGFDVDTVVDEGLAGAPDADVVQVATREGRLVVTLDRGLADIRLHPPGTHAGILVLQVADQRPRLIVEALVTAIDGLDLDDIAGCNVVVRGEEARIRRP